MRSFFEKIQHEPSWRTQSQLLQRSVQPAIANWLFDVSSLTERLVACCSGSFSVQLVTQGWGQPMQNEAIRLRMRGSSFAFIRQVQLTCNNRPWVFARTVIPPRTLSGKRRRLAKLGSKPLGAVLFADTSMRRSEMEIACLTPGQDLYQEATCSVPGMNQAIWGRRSVFYLNKHPLLVSEFFLPGIGDS